MEQELTQTFPRRENGQIVHRSWSVDLECALGAGQAAGLSSQRLRREVAEMAQHFPRWILTVHLDREVKLCQRCQGMLVFDRGLSCVVCDRRYGRPPAGARLTWFGLLPPIGIEGLHRVRDRLVASPPDRHVVGSREGIGRYLLVPLVASYPPDYPEKEPHVHYLPGFFRIPGMPQEAPSHLCHLLTGGRMCLFAPGQWSSSMTCREVLQQRAYAHVIKLLNHADGKHDAFAVVT
ncbi:MAG: hypothetical protein HY815_29240 [Candidatus Riflebacteria bacterium]|nr:hypothetical protein [Candidatus Riflebacteria bacterium]